MAGADYVPLSWISNLPDPVSSYSHGLQIGAQIGSDQARQQLQQQQMLQQQQEQQVRQAHDAAVFQLESQAQARKFAAQQQYQSLIQGGMDPAKALLQVGPQLGANVEGLAMQQQITPFQREELDTRKQQIQATAEARKASLEATQEWRKFQEGLRRKQLEDKEAQQETQLDPVDKSTLAETVKELALVNKKIAETPEQKPGFFGGGNLDDIKALKAKAQELTDRINSFRKGKKTSSASRFRYDRSAGKIVPVDDTQDTSTDDTESDN